MEEEFGSSLVEFHVAKLVDDEEIDTAVAGDGAGELHLVGGFDELVHEPRRERVFDSEPFLRGGGAEPDQEMAFAGAGVADEAERVAAADPLSLREGVDRGGGEVGVGVVVDVVEELRSREACCGDAADGGATVPVVDFCEEELSEESDVGQLFLLRGRDRVGEYCTHGRQAQPAQSAVGRGRGCLVGHRSSPAQQQGHGCRVGHAGCAPSFVFRAASFAVRRFSSSS